MKSLQKSLQAKKQWSNRSLEERKKNSKRLLSALAKAVPINRAKKLLKKKRDDDEYFRMLDAD